MRAVSLSNENVQKKIAESFIPLKVRIDYGTEKFPIDWPAMEVWRDTYERMGGPKTTGITACCVISPDLNVKLGSTGSAFVWELFDSAVYDADKFATMLDRTLERFLADQHILDDTSLSADERTEKLKVHREQVKRTVSQEGKFNFPPKGFTIEEAVPTVRRPEGLTRAGCVIQSPIS